jgi:hypothetical protein
MYVTKPSVYPVKKNENWLGHDKRGKGIIRTPLTAAWLFTCLKTKICVTCKENTEQRQSEGWNRPFVGMGLWPEEEVEGEWWWWWMFCFSLYNRLCFLTDTFNYIFFHFLKSIFLQLFEPTTLHACAYTHDSWAHSILLLQSSPFLYIASYKKKAVYFLQHVLHLSLFVLDMEKRFIIKSEFKYVKPVSVL